ncbi:MAG: FAD-dependent oxidoreductase [Sulfurospirillaceae bacterium]|nr:FAD-dependent oxidoreductase [Sulfurospirillaceae bacterium]
MRNESKKKVMVIGGGYAGISLLHELKKHRDIELTLIDKSPNHVMQTHIHKYLSGHYSKEDITCDYQEYCKKNSIRFIQDEIIDIKFSDNYVETKNANTYKYDYIVIATGATSFFPTQIENITMFTKDIKQIENLDYYRETFLKLLRSKPKNKNILVVGGGVSGLQIACEYAQTILSNHLNSENIAVTLVEGLDTILPNMDKFLIEKSMQRCEQLGVKVINKLFASKIFQDKVVLSNSLELPYDILIFVVGVAGNSIKNIENDVASNQRNQIIVDEYYRIAPYQNAFAIGDIVQAIDVKTKTFQTPTAQASRMQAELVSKNIINSIKGRNLVKNNISNKGIFIDLGGTNSAIGKLSALNIKGKIALWMKKLIYSLHIRKLNKM